MGSRPERNLYHPFGQPVPWDTKAEVVAESKGRTRERYDADAGLQSLNARTCDPLPGLFLQPDGFEVTDPGVGTNRYGYSFNDPVNLRDPGGNTAEDGREEEQEEDEEELTDDAVELAQNLTTSDVVESMLSVIPEPPRLEAGGGGGGRLKTPVWLGGSRIAGSVMHASEGMSKAARDYQKRVTGFQEGTVFHQNGVKFDGVDAAAEKLIDAKYGMDFMIDAATGGFKQWSRAPQKLADQANRQLGAANGAEVEWRFSSKLVADAVRNYFKARDIAGVTIVHVPEG